MGVYYGFTIFRRTPSFLLRHALVYVDNHPKIRVSAIKLLAHFPLLKAHLKAFAQKNMRVAMPIVPFQLPISVKQHNIGADIKLKLNSAVNGWQLGKRVDE